MLMETPRALFAPEPNSETQGYWDAAALGRLVIKLCRSCGQIHYYPRAICPYCMSGETEWLKCTGTGVIYSLSVARRTEPPCALAYVTLDEGVSIMTNIVDCDLDALSIGQRVTVVFRKAGNGASLAMFRPI